MKQTLCGHILADREESTHTRIRNVHRKETLQQFLNEKCFFIFIFFTLTLQTPATSLRCSGARGRCSERREEEEEEEEGVRGAVRVHAHSLVPLSWKLDHRLAIVSRSAKFIINTARAAARCQTERESRASRSPARKRERRRTEEETRGPGDSDRSAATSGLFTEKEKQTKKKERATHNPRDSEINSWQELVEGKGSSPGRYWRHTPTLPSAQQSEIKV